MMQFFKSVLFLFSVILPFSRSEPSRGDNIVDVKEHELPFLASIISVDDVVEEPEYNHYCTGSLISRKHVLTAAHCVANREFDKVNVLVGSSDVGKAVKYAVDTWISHNAWYLRTNKRPPRDENDIAIITLKIEVNGRNVAPGGLAYTPVDNLFEQIVTSVGWGTETVAPIKISRKVALKVIPSTQCRIEIRKFAENVSGVDPDKIEVTDKYFCTRNKEWALIDEGDSGGPVLDRQNRIVGINKGTVPDFKESGHSKDYVNQHQFNFHVSVNFYENFIRHVLDPKPEV